MYLNHWMGLATCVTGVVFVALDELLSAGITAESGSAHEAAFGMGLVLAGQAFLAMQVVLEEYLMKEMHLPAMQIVGWQGPWGLAIMAALYPVMYLLPGHDHGHLTDVVDSMALLANSPSLVLVSVCLLLALSSQNASGIGVTAVLSGVHRKILDGMRSAVVWMFGLIVYYCVDRSSELGQEWTRYSKFELFGFFALVMGQLTYGGVFFGPPPHAPVVNKTADGQECEGDEP